MYRTEVTAKYTFTTKHSSWELKEKVFEYLKKNLKGYTVFTECDSNEIVVTCLNGIIPPDTLESVESYIPQWAKDIDNKQNIKNAKDLQMVGDFIKYFKCPTLPKDNYKYFRVCELLLDVILDHFAYLEREFKKGEGNTCYVADIQVFICILNYAKKGDYKSAHRLYRSLDTSERELIMDAMHLFEEIKGY